MWMGCEMKPYRSSDDAPWVDGPGLIFAITGAMAMGAVLLWPAFLGEPTSTAATERPAHPERSAWALVTLVHDGDTFSYTTQGQIVRVRLANIDAPELQGKCASEIELAERARERLRDLISGRWTVIYAWERWDMYRRLIAKAATAEGEDVGEILIAEGLARRWAGHREGWC